MKYATLEHPSFPSWLKEGLDAIFEAEPRLERVGFDLWVISSYSDETYTELHGGASFTFVEKDGVQDRATEDEMDCIPQVRRFERRAGELWNMLPLTYSDDDGQGSVDGDYEMYATREGHIRFWHQLMTGLEHEFEIEAKWEEGRWEILDRMVIPSYEGSHSDLLVADAQAVIASYSPAELALNSLPTPKSVTIGENDTLVFDFEPGEITRCMETR